VWIDDPKGMHRQPQDKVVAMSRFTFGFLLGAGAGWALGSGKAAEWKRTLEDRRAFGDSAVRSAAAPQKSAADALNGVAPEYGIPSEAATP